MAGRHGLPTAPLCGPVPDIVQTHGWLAGRAETWPSLPEIGVTAAPSRASAPPLDPGSGQLCLAVPSSATESRIERYGARQHLSIFALCLLLRN